jgi:nucleotide-binding universal stress UspA family protein
VIESVPDPTTFPFPERLVAPIRAELEDVARAVRERDVDSATMLLAGRPADEIVSAARRLDAAFVVVGTHARHGLARWALGSVAEAVMRRATMPVVTVPGTWPHDRVDGRPDPVRPGRPVASLPGSKA